MGCRSCSVGRHYGSRLCNVHLLRMVREIVDEGVVNADDMVLDHALVEVIRE